ncbi:uncharacterized protein LOC119735970 [Patiria miniata]|uniref:Uncharacterized protein n=1 Tax=Patiria miniata TaxID=46514 RepID=A0A914AR57_PATMI|nr:uncharacterized protein LOC119735970 [Patiria miniata]
MFSIVALQSVLPLEKEKDVDDLFNSDTAAGQVHSLWGSTGHLFVSLNEGLALKAFDTAPVDQKVQKGKRALAVHQTASEIIEVCALKKKNAPVYIAHRNGTLKAWSYSDSGGWVHLGNISLCVKQQAELHTVTIDEGRGRVIWVEGQLRSNQDGCHYSICTRTMTFESTDVKHSVGPALTLLQNCPKCALYCSPLAVNIWPSDPCPKGMYFTWHSDAYLLKNQLDTHILGHGRCLSEDRASAAVDFKTAASKLRHIWARKATQPDLQVVAKACHLSTGVLFLVSSNGHVHTLSGAEESVNALKFPASVNVADSTGWFAYRFVLGALFKDHVIRLMSNTSGDLLQELDLSSVFADADFKLWSIMGMIPRIGFWSSEGIWVLQMDNIENVASGMSSPEAASTLRDFSEDRLAARTALQGAYEAYSGRSNDEGRGKGVAVPQQGFQNPGLMVSVLQGADATHKPQASQALQSLYERREDGAEPETRLNDTIGPLLQQYWALHREKLGVWDASSDEAQKPFTIQEAVLKLLDSSSTLSAHLKRSEMTYLSLNAPVATLACLLDALNIGKLDDNGHIEFHAIPLDQEELDPSLPPVSLAVKAPESESGLPLFEIVCRLMFRECPTQLVEFVNMCQQARDKVLDVSAFSRKKSTVQLCDIALGSLPGPDHSRNQEGAVLATAKLLQVSAMSHGSLNALKLLLKHKLWCEAICLVQEKADNTQTHSELFHVLLMSILQDREIVPEYYERLWACLPQKISSLEFLKLLTTHHQPSNPRIHLCQQVLCRPQDDLQIGMVREQLISLLGREKLTGQ